MNPLVIPIISVAFAGLFFFGIIALARKSCNEHNGFRKGKGGRK